MIPGNPVVGATVMRIPALQSPNYDPGDTGFFISPDFAEFNNLKIRGEFDGTNFTINSDGAFFYSGTPASGNLIASIAGVAGTDGEGNAYTAGVSSYGAGGAVTSLLQGRVVFDAADDTFMALTGTNLVIASTSPVALFSQIPVQTLTAVEPGTAGTPETWHPITLDAGWTATVTPQYRMLPDGNVQARGQASHAGTTAATNINSGTPIPSGYWPAANRVYRPPDSCDSAGPVQISSAGVFAMRSTVTNGFTATQVIFDGIYSI